MLNIFFLISLRQPEKIIVSLPDKQIDKMCHWCPPDTVPPHTHLRRGNTGLDATR